MRDLYIPDAANWINAYEAGHTAKMTGQRETAQREAGSLLMTDPTAAAAKLAPYDMSGAVAVSQYGAQQKTQQRADQFRAALSKHDYATAGQISAGDPALHKEFAEALADTANVMATHVQSLKGLDQATAEQNYQTLILPALHAKGYGGPGIDDWHPSAANIAEVETQALGLKEQLGLHRPVVVGDSLIDPTTGKPLYEGTKFIPVPEGGKLVPITGGQMGGPASPGGEPGPAPTAAPPGDRGTAAAPRGLRNNNPLNLEASVGWDGMTGSDGRYATFSTPEAGWAAADRNLQTYATKHGLNTVAGIVGRWAPPGENDTGAYAGTVASRLGVDPAAPLNMTDPVVRRHVLEAMAEVENGQRLAWGQGGAQPAAPDAHQPAPGPHAGDPPGTIYGDPKPVEWASDGKGNLVNAKTGDRKVDPTAGADAVANPDLVKAIIDGRAPMPTANRAATDPKWQAAMAEAMAQDPTLDGANYGTRVKTRADFATGTAAKTKTALNTALGHAGDLDGQVDALHNTPIRMINRVGNAVSSETGDPRVKTFNLTKEALLHEAMKVFSGSQGSLQEFTLLSENLNVNDSPAQQHSVIRKLVGLLASKMDALGEQYKTGMGRDLEASQIMSPHAHSVFNKIIGLPASQQATATAPTAAPGAAPKPAHKMTDAELKAALGLP